MKKNKSVTFTLGDCAEDKIITEEDVGALSPAKAPKKAYRFVKRVFDLFFSTIGLLLCVVPFLLVSIVIFIDDPGPVFFRQKRIGRGGRVFSVFKFRTMKRSTPAYLSTMDIESPDEYITRVGKLLRKTSVDELPQLINVFIGNMSLIGPRPLIPEEGDIHPMRLRFGVYQVRPGITGLAQVNGRDMLSPTEKLYYDVEYVNTFSFKTDLRILTTTVRKVFRSEDVVEGAGYHKPEGEKEKENASHESNDTDCRV